MNKKVAFAQRGREMATTLSLLHEQVEQWRGVYWDRGFNAGGADELTDADVEEVGVTAADVVGLLTFADALETFLTANRAYLNRIRQDM
jgi:hypothetical protein